MSIAFSIKILVGLFFYYIYVYKIGHNSEPSDAIRLFSEGKQLNDVFFKSKGDFFSLFTRFGDNARMLHEHMNKTFIWDAGNFTLINDSRNTIRFHSLIHFISNNNILVHFIILNFLSLIGLQQLFSAFRKHSTIKPIYIFYILLLLPSLIFWTSSILKEPFLLLGIGLLSRGIMLKEKNKTKQIIVSISGLLFLILFKPYIFVCLLPAVLFYIAYKYIFHYNLLKVFSFSLIVIILISILFPSKRQTFTEYISRKQFNVENVGNGGIHAYVDYCYYYFKPKDYENIKVEGDYITLINPSEAIYLSVNTSELPKKKFVKPTGEKWKVHIVMPGTKSYFKTTLIENSFQQLIYNIPEAVINAFFRPFPFDNGSIMKFPTMIEAWGVLLFLLISILYKKKINKRELGVISSLAIFAFLLLLLIGWTTPISGAIVRFRFPAQLAIILIGMILIDYKHLMNKISKWINIFL